MTIVPPFTFPSDAVWFLCPVLRGEADCPGYLPGGLQAFWLIPSAVVWECLGILEICGLSVNVFLWDRHVLSKCAGFHCTVLQDVPKATSYLYALNCLCLQKLQCLSSSLVMNIVKNVAKYGHLSYPSYFYEVIYFFTNSSLIPIP